MNQNPNVERPPDDELLESPEGEEELPPDDTIIGKAFRGSMVVLAGIAIVATVVYFIASREPAAKPETAIESQAPQAVTAAVAPAIPFVDVAESSGLRFAHENGAYGDKLLPESMGSGVAVFDFDNDGDQDLFFVNGAHWPDHPKPGPTPTLALYANDGQGRFTDVTAAAGLTKSVYGMGVAAGDVDDDGWVDLFVAAVGPNHLFMNRNGRFEEVTAKAGVAGGANEWSTGAGFFDADGDGDLDLFVCNYVRWSKQIDFDLDFRLTGVGRAYGPPQSYEGTFPYLYRNDGQGVFTDVSEAAGVHVTNPATGRPVAKALAIAPVDVDRDGHMDVAVANDTVRNFFFRSKGDGTFEEVGELYGLAYDRNGNATGAMGTDAAYFRNDQNLGIVIGNFANEMSSLYVSQDDPSFFVDDAITEGIGAPSRLKLTFGSFFFDADLDGRLDIAAANGHLEEEIQKVDPSQRYRQSGQLFWNAGAEQGFQVLPDAATGDLAREIVGRAAAYGDFDGDGDLDIVFTQVAGKPLLLRNDQQLGNHWLRVKLAGKSPNRNAIGAWVELKAGGETQRRQVMPTRSYFSQVELPVTFGLGKATTIESLTISWPDGSQQTVPPPAVDQEIAVEQGG